MDISRFQVRGLFGMQDVDLAIRDNRIVVVGVNGIGKSTTINLFYYLIARRWSKLSEIQFERIGLEIDGIRLELSREEILSSQASRNLVARLVRNLTSHARPVEPALLDSIISHSDWSEADFSRFSNLLNMPPSQLRRFKAMMDERIADDKLNLQALANFNHVNFTLQKHISARILFLPTYRRIEKDLKSIVPDIEDRVRAYEERFGATRSIPTPVDRASRPYIDLVEFGMDDVKKVFLNTTTSLTFFAGQRLNELAGAYLREVLRGEVEHFQPGGVAEFDDAEINSILARVDERTLGPEDKQTLRETLSKLHHAKEFASPREQYIAHFFAKLGNVARALQEQETPIRNFVGVCNKNYLFGKELRYDRNNFTLTIVRTGGAIIDLKDLSSGEKQIVSLFTHIYLSGADRFIIIIDEPELSLSVDWQANFLPDIMKSERCTFLAAVTHSPFIYDNSFEPYTVDLLEHSHPTR